MLQDICQIVINFIICEVYDMQTMVFQDVRSFCIFTLLIFMNRSVYFNYKASSMAIEIHNETCDQLLASKVATIQAVGTQLLPKSQFSRCHGFAQLACEGSLHWINLLAKNTHLTPFILQGNISIGLPIPVSGRGLGG